VTTDAVAAIVDQWARRRPDLDATPILVVGRIARLAQVLDLRLRPPFAAAGLSNGDFDVLAALRRTGPPHSGRPVELSRQLLVTTGAVTKRLDRLEGQGYLRRQVSDDDGRGKLVHLTPAGLELVDRLIAVHLANQARLLGALTPDEREQLQLLLGRLARSLE
jgi:DNA-binding MarR family transcriptional regulator